jgi:hypothetical protein
MLRPFGDSGKNSSSLPVKARGFNQLRSAF